MPEPESFDIVLDMAADARPRRRSVFPGFDAIGSDRPPIIEALVARRRASGLSQAAVAERMGTSQPAVARLESGGSDIRLSTLGRYAEAIDHDVTWDLQAREES